MPCKKEQQVLLNIIHKYRDMPLLWQRDHEHYLNKDMRAECYKILLKIYKTYDQKITMKYLKKKIENMRTTYLKELKKVLASKYTGSEENKAYSYVPTLWYYEALNFLSNDTECSHNVTVTDSYENLDSSSEDEALASVAISNCDRRKRKIMDTPLLYEDNEVKYSTETDMILDNEELELYGRKLRYSTETNTSHEEEFQKNERKLKYPVKTNVSHNDKELELYGCKMRYSKQTDHYEEFEKYGRKLKYLEKTNMSHNEEELEVGRKKHSNETRTSQDKKLEDHARNAKYSVETNAALSDEECKVYGRSIGFQMKDLTKRQLTISQKIISDVLYYAKLDRLSQYTCLVLEPPNEAL